eukprot:gene5006-6992_t
MNFILENRSIKDLNIQFNADGWGPINGDKLSAFEDVPYAHFDKKDKCFRSADFVGLQQYNNQRSQYPKYYRREEQGNADFSFRHDSVEDSTFQLVDSSKTQAKGRYNSGKRQISRNNPSANNKFNRNTSATNRQGGRPIQDNSKGKGNTNSKFNNKGYKRIDRKDRMPSLAVGGDWEMVEEFDLAQLLKLVANPPVVEDLSWCGHLDQYDETYDKITTRTLKPLKIFENKIFNNVTTSDDPILQSYGVDGVGDVYATDAILAQLMAAPRSVYSWDIVIQKLNGMIFLDNRDDSNADLLTVSETAQEPPTISEDVGEINFPDNLSREATRINQNFSQQVLTETAQENRKKYDANPFLDEEDANLDLASVAYRYRKFTLGNIKLVARCELHCWTTKGGEDQFMTCFALNEWDSKYSGGVSWRQKIDTQKGAVLATELKNNSCKLAKWTAQSFLAGAQQMKLGYVSRNAPNNAFEHSILATQFFKPKDLALQINLSINNVWGIVKMISELLLSYQDGKYVLMKDPNKPIVRLYSVPLNTFEDDDSTKSSSDDEDADNIEETKPEA